MRRFLFGFAVAALSAATTLTPVSALRADDLQTAQKVGDALESSGKFAGTKLDIKCENNKVWLRGELANRQQMAEAQLIAASTPGVDEVLNELTLAEESAEPAPLEVQSRPANLPVRLEGERAKPNSSLGSRMAKLLDGGVRRSSPVAEPTPVAEPAQRRSPQVQLTQGLAEPPEGFSPASTLPPETSSYAQSLRPAGSELEKAREIAQQLQETPGLELRRFAVKYASGVAHVRGEVTHPAQESAALNVVKNRPDVKQVVNEIRVRGGQYRQTSVQRPIQGRPARFQEEGAYAGEVGGGPLPMQGMPVSEAAAPMSYDQPHLPNYAWPSYASHPNYAGVCYPKQYSATAWPYIGPFYPYPQVPLGWRKVTMEWDDGWWFLDFHGKK